MNILGNNDSKVRVRIKNELEVRKGEYDKSKNYSEVIWTKKFTLKQYQKKRMFMMLLMKFQKVI